jgi:hypothetical protein
MNDVSELFWQASLEEIKQGYRFDGAAGEFTCLICGRTFADGVVYPHGETLYEARRYVAVHIGECHRSVFHFLLDLDKKLTGLTEHQKTILDLFYAGMADNEVAKELGAGSTSTVRNHRFALRERQKQAKVFLAIMELLAERVPKKSSFIELPRATKNVDEMIRRTADDFGVTSVVISHDMASTFRIGDRIAMLHAGKIIVNGTPQEVLASRHPALREFVETSGLVAPDNGGGRS